MSIVQYIGIKILNKKKEDNRQNDENIESDIFLSQALDVQYQNQ